MKADPRILVFAPAFAPALYSEGLVNSKLVLGMLNAGWDVQVITAPSGGGFTYSSTWSEPWTQLNAVRAEVRTDQGSRLAVRLEQSWNFVLSKYHVASSLWAKKAAQCAFVMHAKRPFDAVISRSTSCVAHLPAMQFRSRIAVPWIANWNDPPAFLRPPPYADELSKIDRYLLMRYLKDAAAAADWNTFPSDRLRAFMAKSLDIGAVDRTRVIPHVGLGVRPRRRSAPNPETFRFCYAGNLDIERDPANVFHALREVVAACPEIEIELEIIGRISPEIAAMAEQAGAARHVRIVDPMPYFDCLDRLANSDAQLLIDPRNSGLLMLSKIPDYADVGVPILAVSPADSTTADMMRQYRVGKFAANSSIPEIVVAMKALIAAKREGGGSYDFDRLREAMSSQTVVELHRRLIEAGVARTDASVQAGANRL